MATFTHTITWLVSIEGKATSYAFTYTVPDVDDFERFASGRQADTQAVLRSEPVFSAILVDIGPGTVGVVEAAGPTALPRYNVDNGDLVVFHQSDTGGTWNSSNSAATTTLRANDQISAGAVSANHAGFDIIVLHQPAS